MTIQKNHVVALDYTLTDKTGEVLDSTDGMEPLSYIHGTGSLIPGLEKELEGKKTGDKISVTVAAADAYGEYKDDLVIEIPRSQFPADAEIKPGMQFQAGTADGGQVVTVTAVADDKITVDANHPLAGEDLTFAVEIMDVREATAEELEKGLYADEGCGCGCGCGDDCDGDCDCDNDCCGEDHDCGCGCH